MPRMLCLATLLLGLLAGLPAEDAPARPKGLVAVAERMIAADLEKPPAKGGIEFVGSSTFTRWKMVGREFAPLPVFNRAFGGSTVDLQLQFVDRLVLPHQPRVVVYYCGDNDLATPGNKADKAVDGFREFAARVRTALPETRLVYVSIKPSPKRLAIWDEAKKANAMIRDLCSKDPHLTFVDIAAGILDASGKPQAELFADDHLHLNEKGYQIIRTALRPAIEAAWTAAGGAAAGR